MSTSHKNRYHSSAYHYQEKSSSIVKSQSDTTYYYRRQHHYISPLEKLDKLTQRYCPGKLKKNNALKDLYNNGKCGKFELPPSLFKKFYINRQTSISVLNDLIDYTLHIKNYMIDRAGTDWFNRTYPQSIHIQDGVNDQYTLQSAIYITFNEWLDKRMTLANWGCSIDLLLQTYRSMNYYDDIKDKKFYDEKQIRQ
ncbi:unnamed protein product [Rotaria sp. Silwood1]|nr:unnamed protein product [Rotaria sp. Silwood1]CAF1646826.1 unnamed protein product [Rotaria sp. Silwood1]